MCCFALNKYLTASKIMKDSNMEATAFLELLGSLGTVFVFKYNILLEVSNK